MRKSWLWPIGIAVAAFVSWAGNLWVYSQHHLDRPIFLKHYYELTESMLTHTWWYYIDNPENQAKPYQLELPNGVRLPVQHVQSRDRKGRLQLHTITTAGNRSQEPGKLEASYRFDRVKVYYSNGTVVDVPIGEVIVHPDRSYPAHQTSGMSSSSGEGSSSFTVKQKTTVASLAYSFADQLKDRVHTELGRFTSEPVPLPIHLEEGDGFTLRYNVRFAEDDGRRFQAFNLVFRTIDEKGANVSASYLNIQPSLYAKHLTTYVRMRQNEGDLR